MLKSAGKIVKKKTRVLSVMVKKGGISKTTTAVNLSAALMKLGHKVLMIDLDSQHNGTERLNCGPATAGHSAGDGILKGDLHTTPENYYIHTGWPGLDLMAANKSYTLIETKLSEDSVTEIRDFVHTHGHNWDWIVIDCPNNFHYLTLAAFVASDGVIVPVDLNDDGSVRSIPLVVETIQKVKRYNPKLSLWGILLTKYGHQSSLTSTTLDWIKNEFKLGNKIFKTKISKIQYISNANAMQWPAVLKYPNHGFVNEFFDLAKEVMSHE